MVRAFTIMIYFLI